MAHSSIEKEINKNHNNVHPAATGVVHIKDFQKVSFISASIGFLVAIQCMLTSKMFILKHRSNSAGMNVNMSACNLSFSDQ